jgi:metal-dependent amidase/aminoacylase/carboxypeptidase family protein
MTKIPIPSKSEETPQPKMDITALLKTHLPSLAPYESIYKNLHQNPGLSLQEYLAAKTAANHLNGLEGFDVRTGIGGTGLIGILKGEGEGKGKTVLLRADTDALPVEELTGLEYRSQKREVDVEDGVEKPVMHACGHDMHVACSECCFCLFPDVGYCVERPLNGTFRET